MELHVLLSKARLPDIAHWQVAIDDLGFDVKLDPETVPASHTGFLPAKLRGRETGFEFDVGSALEIAEAYPDSVRLSRGRECSANFRWGGDLDEMASALVASAALTQLSDGVWFDPQESECRDAAGAIAEARAGLDAVE